MGDDGSSSSSLSPSSSPSSPSPMHRFSTWPGKSQSQIHSVICNQPYPFYAYYTRKVHSSLLTDLPTFQVSPGIQDLATLQDLLGIMDLEVGYWPGEERCITVC